MQDTASERERADVLSRQELSRLDAYWRAANYLSVGQIYLLDNPLLREPLKPEHIKPRLLGHWGTTPGLNFIYAHLNRVIKAHDLNVIYVCGPGHGGPGMVANTYLEGTYSEIYPSIGQDGEGMRRLLRIAVPRCREWAGLRLAVAHDARDNQVQVVERGAIRVRKSIAELAAFVN
jgi:xylulose-5-phosphate/fructose-6-phosphate phosphoketolase